MTILVTCRFFQFVFFLFQLLQDTEVQRRKNIFMAKAQKTAQLQVSHHTKYRQVIARGEILNPHDSGDVHIYVHIYIYIYFLNPFALM